MSDSSRATGFAPFDPTDGRDLLDWDSKYSEEARKQIRLEGAYLGLLLAFVPLALLATWLGWPQVVLGVPADKSAGFARYVVSWLAGTLGGTLFDLKWLYHTVARRMWHVDRRLWRVFTPHISGGLSFAVYSMVTSGLIRVFDGAALGSLPAIVGAGFLVGYFSDSAVAKLSEIAETLFGVTRRKAVSARKPTERKSLPKA